MFVTFLVSLEPGYRVSWTTTEFGFDSLHGLQIFRYSTASRPALWPPGRPERMWEDNMNMDLKEIGWGDMDWIHVAQDWDKWRALVNTVMNLRVP
jgi:hypothetical protein